MRTLKRIVVASSCLVAIVMAIGFVTGGVVNADPKASDVRVVNTAGEAVPMTLTNTSVPVTLGSATVPVTLGSAVVPVTLSGATVAVSYSNTKATPLFVDEGNIARAGVAAYCNMDFSNGETRCTLGTVPAGKVLVIESASCWATVQAGLTPSLMLAVVSPWISGLDGRFGIGFPLALAKTQSTLAIDYYAQVVPVRLYAAGGFDVSVGASGAGRIGGGGCTISGHLVTQ